MLDCFGTSERDGFWRRQFGRLDSGGKARDPGEDFWVDLWREEVGRQSTGKFEEPKEAPDGYMPMSESCVHVSRTLIVRNPQ